MAQIPKKLCDSCNKQKGEVYCFNCRYVLCPSCQKSHENFPITAKHTVRNLVQTNLECINRYSCKDHDQEFSYFCQQCKCLVCPECPVSTHQGHTLGELKEMAALVRKNLQNNITHLKNCITDEDKLISYIERSSLPSVRQENEKLTNSIHKIAEQLHSMVDLVLDEYITKTTNHKHVEEESLKQSLRKLENQRLEYAKVLDELEMALIETYDPIFMIQQETILRMLSNLEKVPKSVNEPEILENITMEEFVRRFFNKMKDKHGVSIDFQVTDSQLPDLERQKSVASSETMHKSCILTEIHKITVDPKLLTFFKYASAQLTLPNELKKINAYIVLPVDKESGTLSICAGNLRAECKSTGKEVEIQLDNFLKQYCTENINVPLERWGHVLSELRTINITDPYKVCIFVRKDKNVIVISGEKEEVKYLTGIIRSLSIC